MKNIILDSGVLITLASNCLTKILPELNEKGINFIITKKVKDECIKTALKIPRYSFEGIRILYQLCKNNISISDADFKREKNEFLKTANNIFSARNHPIRIVHEGEAEVISLAKVLNADYIGVDEKTTRLLIEDPLKLHNILESKLHTKVKINKHFMNKTNQYSNIKVLRSSELVFLAFEKGVFNNMIRACKEKRASNKKILESMLWSLKYSGCAISSQEIKEYKNFLH